MVVQSVAILMCKNIQADLASGGGFGLVYCFYVCMSNTDLKLSMSFYKVSLSLQGIWQGSEGCTF